MDKSVNHVEQKKPPKENSCAKCGACTTVCPIYQITGLESLTARGRLHLLEKMNSDKHSQAYLDIFSKCLLCDACHQVCPRDINLPAMVIETRRISPQPNGQGSFAKSLIKGCLSHQFVLAGISKLLKISTPLLDKIPTSSGLRLKLGLPAPEHNHRTTAVETSFDQAHPDGLTKSMLFPGCLARYLRPDITSAATELVYVKDKHTPDTPAKQTCCGLAFYSSGDIEEARKSARINIAAFEGTDTPIIVLCGSCFSHLNNYPDLMIDDSEWHPRAIDFANRLRELSIFLTEHNQTQSSPIGINNKSTKRRVLYHDSCHLRNQHSQENAPRLLLKDLPWVELVELPGGPQCCGFGGLFNLAHPDLSTQISGKLIENILKVNPDLVVTTCSGCLIQLKKHLAAANSSCKVQHLTQVLTSSKKIAPSTSQASF